MGLRSRYLYLPDLIGEVMDKEKSMQSLFITALAFGRKALIQLHQLQIIY